MLPRAVTIQRWWDPEPVFRAVLVAMLLAFAWGFGAVCHVFTQSLKSQELEAVQRCTIQKTLECVRNNTDFTQCIAPPALACLTP
jgi:hypothetical protein